MEDGAGDRPYPTIMARRAFVARMALLAGGALAGMSLLVAASGCSDQAAATSQPAAAPLSVDAAACVGCKRCVAVAPEAYRMNAQTRKAEVIPGAPVAALEAGARVCPVHAIH